MIRALSVLSFLVIVLCGQPAWAAPAHHGAGKYLNPFSDAHQGSFFGIIRARFGGEWQTYDPDRDQIPVTQPQPVTAPAKTPRVTWVGHATLLIQHQGINVLTDPMFSKYASPVRFAGPARVTQPALKVEDLPEIHAVVISHDHYDHLDVPSVRQLGNSTRYFVPLGHKEWFARQGIDPDRVAEMDWWDEQTLSVDGRELTITATPAQHFSGRGLFDRNRRLWASWAVRWSDFNTWFGGDTGYNTTQFKEIGNRYGPFDFAMIPIGAYAPRWFMSVVHVDPAEAVKIHQDIAATRSMGMHWGAFELSAEGVATPRDALAEAVESAGLSQDQFDTFAVGETRFISRGQP